MTHFKSYNLNYLWPIHIIYTYINEKVIWSDVRVESKKINIQ